MEEIKKEKPKFIQRKSFYILLFLIGFMIFSYPIVTRYYYSVKSVQEVKEFETEKERLEKIEINRRIDLAHAYNETLESKALLDPFTHRQKEGRREYARMLEVKEKIGHIEIPRLNLDLPVYAGTSEEVLQKGAGHLEGTSLPVGGESTHSVITAHRGLPENKLFSDLNKVKEGDVFYYHNIKEVLAYKVIQTKVVLPTALEEVLVKEGKDLCTLLTCTPYMINSHRLLVFGERIPYDREAHINDTGFDSRNWTTFVITFMIILFLSLFGIYFYKKHKRYKDYKRKNRR